ncbi:dynein light chain Tctex-type 5-like [Pectinophora gossypiella]|uniref:dynein light chain Tctex-type 5-like n=1 Tax=Pectinophora gossypiella TaxID=13191 RepID=UPI00214DF4A0|nr:dynein light chain Tctex-type 5-like [Pectinophora gossypiella]
MSEITGIKPTERTSMIGLEFKRPIQVYLPTYQLEPRVPLSLHQITVAVDDILDICFNGHVYQQALSPAVATRIAAMIVRTLKYVYDRYRILCVVAIGQKRSQSYNNAIGFIWDGQRDMYVDRHREEPTAFVQVTVFAVYLD